MTPIQACIERFLLGADVCLRAQQLAVAERASNDRTNPLFRLALNSGKLWAPGKPLKVRFLDGDLPLHRQVLEVARRWTEGANISLVDVTSQPGVPAEIRILFGGADRSWWSYVGTDCLSIAQAQPTMNLAGLMPTSPDLQRVVLHEFGHALGCEHEHQSPASPIPWNLEALCRFFGGAPNFWSREKVMHNVVRRLETTSTQYSAFDARSIMLYPVPAELTDGVYKTDLNHDLSATDRDFIRRAYPFEGSV